MAFVPENPLEESLMQAVTDPLARPAFYKLLMASLLVVPGRRTGDAERPGLTIPTLRHNGREYLPAFTALSRLTAFAGGEREHFTLEARTLFATAVGAHFALNPNSACGKLLTPPEIAYWLDPSALARRALRGAEVRLTPPTAAPMILIDALNILFRGRSTVKAAYLLDAEPVDGSEKAHPLIGIDAGDWEKIAAEVSELSAAVAPQMPIDLLRIDPGEGPQSLSARLLRSEPFYQRITN